MYGEIPYMGSRLLKGFKKSPRCVMHRGLCYVESEFKNIFFLPFYLFTFLPFHYSTTIGLYLGTNAFMMHQPTR